MMSKMSKMTKRIMGKSVSVSVSESVGESASASDTTSKQKPIKLGEGTYGCVYKPAFKCAEKDSSKIITPHVGKVFFDDIDAKIEINIAKILQDFGEEANKYLIVPIKSCNTHPKENYEIRKCNLPKDRLKSHSMSMKDRSTLMSRTSFIQQIIPYGGITLYESIRKRSATLLGWLESLVGTFKALEYLHSKGYAHLDIKLDNIVVSDNVRLLDFGFMTRLDTIYTDTANNFIGTYRIYPLELRLYWLIQSGYRYNINEIIDDFLSDYLKLGLIKNREDVKKNVLPKIFDEKLLREAPTKIDVYSVGTMCLFEHPLLLRFENDSGYKNYVKFLQNIIDIDFTKRYSSSKAIAELEKIINMIKKT